MTIFECETEVGQCSCEPGNMPELRYAEPDFSIVLAQTAATLNGRQGVLKIEHHCYLRHRGENPDQPWVKPEVFLEPVLGTKEEMIELAKESHDKFIERVRKKLPEGHLV